MAPDICELPAVPNSRLANVTAARSNLQLIQNAGPLLPNTIDEGAQLAR